MGDRREFQQLVLVLIQLVVVLLIASVISMISHTDLTRSGIVILSFLHIVAFYLSSYSEKILRRGYLEEFVQTLRYSSCYAILTTFVSFMLKDNFSISRRGVLYFIAANLIGQYILNTFIKHYYRELYPRLKSSRKMLVVTILDRADATLHRLMTSPAFNGTIVAISTVDSIAYRNPDIPFVVKEQLLSYATKSVVDEVLINLPSGYPIRDYIAQFENMGIQVNVVLNAFNFYPGEKKLREVGDFNVVTFSTNFYKPSHIFAKRLLDILGSLAGLFLCGIAYLCLASKIKKDGGPAIFKQERVGQNGRIFDFYKFRSMYMDAEERKKELMAHNTMTGGMFKMDDDPRITPIGQFIRKTSLDELPQFYNVLKGDMSLVGTRPPTKDEYEHYTPDQKRRLSFKPGITGLWQVSGRSEITDFEEVVKLDLEYIDGWTIWSDIKILLKTLKVVMMKDGAK
ncbi:sugar transferase [Streptococcus himalayensis]|uniref:Galactosyl transferase n=1 Tax=Streptococcus himalayensis TaxID=1888195 RepID=A0A917A219_9STRE|nr:sugar transferase [Streptococcus himalayensis]GGE23010.1 galactosyl transferase [Streptococcus himalayensis]